MGDLEETIFQRNVPGKYSKWDDNNARDLRREPDHENVEEADDNAEGPVGEDMELLQYAQQLSNADIPESIRQSILAERATKSSTGVKGVLADYRAAQAMAEAESAAIALQRQQILTRMVEGAKVRSTAEVMQEEEALASAEHAADIDIDLDDWEDDGDDAFMREFRAKRLQELKHATQTATAAAIAEPKKFGFVREIRSEDFISEIEKEDTGVTVVVHLYEPAVQVCIRLNSMLDELAATMPAVKFVRMQGSSNEIVVDKVALPILTLYRGGEMIETLAGIAADFGPYFTTQDITWLLETSIPR